ncbi:MAG TPA: HAD family hydrolase [Vicinamibacterales bacterium]|nr:HAD family hydrolase [Vicinamibacterales bacterium]
MTRPIRAVFFDVDFTLIHPGPAFRGEGYRAFCERHGITVDASRFDTAVAAASYVLDEAQDLIYQDELFHRYTAEIIRGMGGEGDAVEQCAREMYAEWAECRHFLLYEDVPEVLRTLSTEGYRIGLISNSHRCLVSFQSHFELQGLIHAALSSSEHGYMKPHPSIFAAALAQIGARPEESVMVGDSLSHDIVGARRVGMKGVLVKRSADEEGERQPPPEFADVPIIRTLRELPGRLRL